MTAGKRLPHSRQLPAPGTAAGKGWHARRERDVTQSTLPDLKSLTSPPTPQLPILVKRADPAAELPHHLRTPLLGSPCGVWKEISSRLQFPRYGLQFPRYGLLCRTARRLAFFVAGNLGLFDNLELLLTGSFTTSEVNKRPEVTYEADWVCQGGGTEIETGQGRNSVWRLAAS